MPTPSRKPGLSFWAGWLVIASLGFALQAFSWTVLGSFDPLGVYDGWLAEVLYGTETLPPDARPALAFGVRLLGATTCGYFVLFAGIAGFALRRGARWAHASLTAALLTWFLLDSAMSLLSGVVFNVWLVNLPCFVALALPLAATAGACHGPPAGAAGPTT